MADVVTKGELLAKLRRDEKEIVEKLEGLPAEAFEKGAYENGWNGRQVLSHVVGIEWTYPKLLDVARNAGKPQEEREKPKEPATKAAQGGIGSYNDRTVERYKDYTVPQLIEDFKKNRANTIAAVEAADDELFAAPVRSAGGIEGPLGTVMNYVAVLHVEGHVDDIVSSASK
jgi:hypothetical protein